MKFRRLDPEEMPPKYYVIAIIIILTITFTALYLVGEVDNLWDFLTHLRKTKL